MKVIRTTEYAAEAWTTDDPRIANAMADSVEGCVASLDGSYCDPGSGRALGVYVFGAAGRSGGYLRADAEEIRYRIDYVREPGCGFEYYGGYSHEAEALEMLESVRARGWEAKLTDTAAACAEWERAVRDAHETHDPADGALTPEEAAERAHDILLMEAGTH